MVFVRGAPYTNGAQTRCFCLFFAPFHCLDVLHIQHPAFSFWYLRKQLRQAAVWAHFFVLVLPQNGLVDRNNVLRASQSLKGFRCRSNAYNQCAPTQCGFTYGVSCDAGKVGFGAVCWKQNDVVRLITDDDLEL